MYTERRLPHYPEKFENDVFALKTHQMFSFHTTPEKFENATSRVVIVTSSFIFDKFCFQNVFPSYQNVKPAFSNSSVLCWIGTVWTVGLTVDIKLRL